MALLYKCYQNMHMLRNVLARPTWRTAQTNVSRRKFGFSPLANASALETYHQNGRGSGHQLCNSRFITSLESKELIVSLESLIDDDMARVRENCLGMLREHIRSDEMYNIATYYYENNQSPLYLWTSAFTFLAKALNYHTFNNGTLTTDQLKLIALFEMALASYLLHDDIGDDSSTRFKLPSAHLIWNPYKVVVTGNMMLAITLNEAAKLSNDAVVNLCLAHERQYQGQFMENSPKFSYGDRLGYHLSAVELKAGSMNCYWFKALAGSIGVSDRLTDIAFKLGLNNGILLQLVDDIKDVRADLTDGRATATVIFASKEHPILEEMIMRKFQEEGDVEKAMQLVDNSKGREEAKILAERYFAQAKSYMDLLAVSPYLDGLKKVLRLQFERKVNGV